MCEYEFSPTEFDSTNTDTTTVEEYWSCPQKSYKDYDKCIFHLDEDTRELNGVSSEDIVEKFESILREKDSGEWKFIGANIPEITLNQVEINNTDKYPIDLRHATIKREFSIQWSDVRHSIDLRHATVGSVNLQESKLLGRCLFTGTTFEGQFNAEAAVFNEDVDFEGCTFNQEVNLEETRFYGDTCLRNTEFHSKASFDGVEFQGDANLKSDDACFEHAVFHSDASFIKARFRYADFIGVNFDSSANFDEAIFTGDAEFAKGTFDGPVSFRGTEFQGDANLMFDDADFSDVTFHDEADFTQSKFNLANFKRCKFNQCVTFESTEFGNDAMFDESQFIGKLNAKEARFGRDTSFENATFEGLCEFQGVEFKGGDNTEDDDITFESATFADTAKFDYGIFGHTNFIKCEFSEVSFINVKFNHKTEFSNSTFKHSALFTEARFRSDSNFKQTSFGEDAIFRGCEFQGGDNIKSDDLTFKNSKFGGMVDFTASIFRFANFKRVTCEGSIKFNDAEFERRALFDFSQFDGDVEANETRFKSDLSFEESTISGFASFRGAEFRGNANIERDDVNFDGTHFQGSFDLTSARIGFASFKNAHISGRLTVNKAVFEKDFEFDNSIVESKAELKEINFNEDVSMKNVTFEDEVRFDGTEFRGGDNIVEDDLSLWGSIFRDEVHFNCAEFGYTDISNVTIHGDAYFNRVIFERSADIENSEFKSNINFEEAVFERDCSFKNSTIHGEARFFGAEFEGWSDDDNDANFNETQFNSTACFDKASLGSAGFDDTKIEGKVSFNESTFEKFHADGATFEREVDISFVNVDKAASFENVLFSGSLTGQEIRFNSDVSFEASTFEMDVNFKGAEFSGGAYTVTDANFSNVTFESELDFSLSKFRLADFSESVFRSEADFSNCEFKTMLFNECNFMENAKFKNINVESKAAFTSTKFKSHCDFFNSVFNGLAKFQHTEGIETIHLPKVDFNSETILSFKPISDEILIDLKHAKLSKGEITQPEYGQSFYDCTNAELQEIVLDNENCDIPLFDHYRFCVTTFDGFDWSSHKSHLSENNWKIHEFSISPELLPDGESSNVTNPATLENTYLKAKNGAKEFGDRKAAAEFFIREMLYRKEKNWKIATGYSVSDDLTSSIRATDIKDEFISISKGSVDIFTRIRALGKWAGNTILYQSCGYGERLWRIVYVSSVAIVIWAAFYTLLPSTNSQTLRTVNSVSKLTSFDGIVAIVQNMYFSTATFITLEYVGDPGSSFARWLASLEAYFGALLIALVVFVLGRRVAW